MLCTSRGNGKYSSRRSWPRKNHSILLQIDKKRLLTVPWRGETFSLWQCLTMLLSIFTVRCRSELALLIVFVLLFNTTKITGRNDVDKGAFSVLRGRRRPGTGNAIFRRRSAYVHHPSATAVRVSWCREKANWEAVVGLHPAVWWCRSSGKSFLSWLTSPKYANFEGVSTFFLMNNFFWHST